MFKDVCWLSAFISGCMDTIPVIVGLQIMIRFLDTTIDCRDMKFGYLDTTTDCLDTIFVGCLDTYFIV